MVVTPHEARAAAGSRVVLGRAKADPAQHRRATATACERSKRLVMNIAPCRPTGRGGCPHAIKKHKTHVGATTLSHTPHIFRSRLRLRCVAMQFQDVKLAKQRLRINALSPADSDASCLCSRGGEMLHNRGLCATLRGINKRASAAESCYGGTTRSV